VVRMGTQRRSWGPRTNSPVHRSPAAPGVV
jgi:hypothetical protein